MPIGVVTRAHFSPNYPSAPDARPPDRPTAAGPHKTPTDSARCEDRAVGTATLCNVSGRHRSRRRRTVRNNYVTVARASVN